MSIDNFDIRFLEHEGTPQETLLELMQWNVKSFTNSKKSRQAIRRYLNHKLNQGDRKISDMEEMVIKTDGSRVTKRMLLLSEGEKNDPMRIMELMGYDPLQWKLEWAKTRRADWNVTIKNAYGQGDIYTNHAYMCEINVRPLQAVLSKSMVEEIFANLEPPNLHIYRGCKNANLMLELPIMDLHLGKMGIEEWGIDAASSAFRNVITDVLERIESYGLKIEKIVFPIGQDFFHIDTPQGTTTGGTHVEPSNPWYDIYKSGIDLLVWAIENLRRVAPVELMYVYGNHDEMLSYCAVMMMASHFRSVENVIVDISPMPRKYIHYGKNLIGLGHGDKEGKRIEGLMQVEAAEAWGKTKFREFHLGHLHSSSSVEKGGLIIRHVASITPPDKYHVDRGWLGAVRKAQAFIWDRDHGKLMTLDINM